MFGWIIGTIISGGIIGAVARLILPGEQDLSIWQTIGIGAVASLVSAGILSFLLPGWLLWIASVAVAAGIIWFVTKRRMI